MKNLVLRNLSRQYETSALLLRKKRCWSASYHLAGLSVEFALKACIARKFVRSEIPEKRFVQQIYTHELGRLVILAGLEPDRTSAEASSPVFSRCWSTVRKWDADSRYRVWSMVEAQDMLDAVTEPIDGATAWIRSHW